MKLWRGSYGRVVGTPRPAEPGEYALAPVAGAVGVPLVARLAGVPRGYPGLRRAAQTEPLGGALRPMTPTSAT